MVASLRLAGRTLCYTASEIKAFGMGDIFQHLTAIYQDLSLWVAAPQEGAVMDAVADLVSDTVRCGPPKRGRTCARQRLLNIDRPFRYFVGCQASLPHVRCPSCVLRHLQMLSPAV